MNLEEEDERRTNKILAWLAAFMIVCLAGIFWYGSYNSPGTKHYTYEGKEYFIHIRDEFFSGIIINLKYGDVLITGIYKDTPDSPLVTEKIHYYPHFFLDQNKKTDYEKLIPFMLNEGKEAAACEQ